MLDFVIAGLALGSIYALSAVGVVLTYVSSGVLNFAFASIAYMDARFYYWLHTQQGWSIAPAAIVSILIVGPVTGAVLWAVLFRYLRLASDLIKIVSTIGLAVAIPAIVSIVFGNPLILTVPGLAPEPVRVFKVVGVAVTMDQVIIYACLLVVVVAGGLLLRFTAIGLSIRATVDSEALAELSAISPRRVAVGVWAASTTIAGLAGVLAAPIIGITVAGLTLLVAASFAAVIVAGFRRLGAALAAALLMGVVSSLVQWYVRASPSLSAAIEPSIPFIFIFVTLVVLMVTGRGRARSVGSSALDEAIRPQFGRETARASASGAPRRSVGARVLPVVFVVAAALTPFVLSGFWRGLVGLGFAYAVVFMGYSLVTGEGGMIWLCQISLAGLGAIGTAALVTHAHLPFVLSLALAGLMTAVVGLVIGLLTIRLGDIYVALVTLTFGLLVENLVFTIRSVYNLGQGILVARPDFAKGDRAYSLLALAAFVLVAMAATRFRGSTAGLALNAVRWSESAATTTGVSGVAVKLLVSAIAAFMAGVGGGLLAGYVGAATSTSYATVAGLTWLAVLVTVGVRSNTAAAVAGLALSFIPAIFLNYLPTSLDQLPTALFGLGAILVARNPDGTVAMHARQLEALIARHHGETGGKRSSSALGLEHPPPEVLEKADVSRSESSL